MADDKQRKPALDDLDDASGSGADDPTAVWDAEALRAAGLDDFTKLPEPTVRPAVTPAMQASGPSIVVDNAAGAPAAAPQLGGPSKTPVPVPAEPRKEMSWATTVGLAAALGAVVYVIIRFLR